MGLPKGFTTEHTEIAEKTFKKLPRQVRPGQVCALCDLRGEKVIRPLFRHSSLRLQSLGSSGNSVKYPYCPCRPLILMAGIFFILRI